MSTLILKQWTRNGAVIGLVAALVNILVLGKGPYDLFLLLNVTYILGHIIGGAVLGSLAAAVTNATTKR